ncbi:MAG: class I SAM-dependent methyltransferase [Chloroflexota bacterium]
MNPNQRYYERLAAAFVRSKLQNEPIATTETHWFNTPLEQLTGAECQALIQLGLEHELRIHRFKQTMGLPRVRKVLGILKSLCPLNLLDIGSGRGVFLWPLLDEFPDLPITAVDTLDYRVADLQAMCNGGVSSLSVEYGDATNLPFPDRTFDVITMLEVLEHIPDTKRALTEVCRVAQRFVVISVPSKPDDNPEHIHLFDRQTLTSMLQKQPVDRITFDDVHNHIIAVARITIL